MKIKLLLLFCAGTLSVMGESLVRKFDFDRNTEAWYAPPY